MSLYSPDDPRFIRGVNIGGWLVLERYITPYSFAVTDCHQRGDFCWYPGQIDAPSLEQNPDYKLCDISECQAVLAKNAFGKLDYSMDEWNLAVAFQHDKDIGARWLNSHFEHFLQKDDLIKIKQAGITHVRVPLPHWILGDIQNGEPWIAADRWKYFVRMCGWAREIGLEVWPNIHSAPGSQNGFDNSGVQNSVKTCGGWSDDPHHVQRSLDVILEVAVAIKQEGLLDVVTGFGLLNEPFADCDFFTYQEFLEDGRTIIRRILGDEIGIYMSDLFAAPKFNDGHWGLDPEKFNNTFLDSHYYNVFTEETRSMTPYEHLESVCTPIAGERVDDCCFEDGPHNNQIPSHGVQRIVAEWSAAYDCMPGEVLKLIMKGIYEKGIAPLMDRQISPERQGFLTKFIQAQIVSYEAADIGFAHGWFFWTLKLEGGAYIEWDFLRGLEEGWFPPISSPDVPSESFYGSCESILNQIVESEEIVHEYPWGDLAYWRGSMINETDTIEREAIHTITSPSVGSINTTEPPEPINNYTALKKKKDDFDIVLPEPRFSEHGDLIFVVVTVVFVLFGWRRYSMHEYGRKRHQYTELQT